LIGLQPDRSTRFVTPRKVVVMTLMCLALMVLLAVVQVVHVHPLQSDADHCPLCIVLHTLAPVSVTPAIVILVQMGTLARVAEVRSVVRPWFSRLLTRPPPISL
jgi:NADH:ubiquinone oxidoreductase subunit K